MMKEVDIISKVVGRNLTTDSPVGKAPSLPAGLSQYLLKEIWDKVFEVKTDNSGNEFIYGKLPVVTKYGVTMHGDTGEVDLPSLYDGLPIDGKTIYWDNGVLKALGGSGEADSVLWANIKDKPSWLTDMKPTYNYTEIDGIPDLSEFATLDDLAEIEDKLYDFLEGSDTDTIINKWLELEDFLEGLSESDNLAYILSNKANMSDIDAVNKVLATKWTQDNAKIANWDKAYSWGNHADAGYLLGKTYTANDVLEKLKTVGGKGSGLDADKLDGIDSKSLPLLNGILNTSDNLDDALRAGYYKVVSPTNLPDGIYPYGMLDTIEVNSSVEDSEGRTVQIYYPHISGSEYGYCGLAVRVRNSGSWSGWRKFTTAAGLEASYLKKTGGTLTGTLVSCDIYPVEKEKYNLGTSLSAWKEIYSSVVNTTIANVGGIGIYKSQDGVLYIDGNLVVKGGVTAYGDTSVTASTIMDAIRVDGVTISKANGYLEVIGGAGGGLDEDSLEKYLQTNKYLTQTTGDARYVNALGVSGNHLTWIKNGISNSITIPYATKATQDSEGNTINSTYLKLSGGTVSGNITINGGSASSVFTIRRSPSVIAFQNSGGTSLGYLGFSGANTPCMYTTSSIAYTLLHSNNYNSYAPKLDGTGASGTWGISISGNASMATRLTDERTIWGNPFDGTKNVSGDMTDVGSISMKGHLYLMGVSDTSSIANKTQILFGTSPSNVHIALSSNKNSLIINPSESTTAGQIVLGVNGGNTIFKSTGNFGIGVENPSIKCEVDGDIGNDRCLMHYSTSNPYLKLKDTYNGVNYNHYIAAYEGKLKLGKSLSIGITIDDGGNVEVSGNLIVKGGITMYGTESAEGYTSDFVPRETGTYNIGSSERRWKSLFACTADLSDGLVMSTIDNDKAFNDKGITFGENGIVRFGVNRSNDLGIYAGGRIFLRPSSLTGASSVGMVIETTGNAYLSGGLTIGETSSNANIVNNAYKLYVTGKAYITSTITQNSDIRYKEIHKDLRLSLATMAEAPSFEFHFTDGETKDTHIGTSAQYWQYVEGVVHEGADGRLGMDYASLGVVIGISLAKEVAKYESETDRRIRLLEKENEELRNEINKLKVA